MKKGLLYFASLLLVFISCQKEIHFTRITSNAPIPEKLVTAIVIVNPPQNEYDSIVFRYSANKISEVHYTATGDSVTRAYDYDAAGRLAKIEDEKALYYTNNHVAHTIRFEYNNLGQLSKTLTDFETVKNVPAYFNYKTQGNQKQILIYDTSYITPAYDLGWANRIIYNTVSNDNYLLYDSAIFFNDYTRGIKTLVSDFVYDAEKNASTVNQHGYFDGELTSWGAVDITTDRSAPVYEGLRKKLFRGLANWYEASSVLQDDNYHFFTAPGHMYKQILYKGFSNSGGTQPLNVTRTTEYKNEYSNDFLQKTMVTFSLTGQGSIAYVNFIRYYYN
jgi:YD repeat-containing protein